MFDSPLDYYAATHRDDHPSSDERITEPSPEQDFAAEAARLRPKH